MYRRERSLRDGSFPQRRRTPSFSSSLLDAIYRSTDDSIDCADHQVQLSFYCDKTMIKKQRNYSVKRNTPVEEAHFRRAIMIENWMEKQSSLESPCLHFNNSTSTSSESSSGAVFSSSETESSYKERSRRSKPVRSMKCMQFDKIINEEIYHQQKIKAKPNGEGGFSKTKLKALKIYGELKKVKQPISPGGRITNFLNSIFSSGNGKKVNVCTVKATEDVNFDSKSKSACSSATSFSRSCLSKTPNSSSSSRSAGNKYSGNNNNGKKRSVRFYPVSVIVDEDCRPCGHKCIYDYELDDPSLLPLQNVKANYSLKPDEFKKKEGTAARSTTTCTNKGISQFVTRGFAADADDEDDDDEEEEEDDAFSYSSSDLFELDHLKGIGRYREELPVYETTNLKKNQAIVNRFIL